MKNAKNDEIYGQQRYVLKVIRDSLEKYICKVAFKHAIPRACGSCYQRNVETF